MKTINSGCLFQFAPIRMILIGLLASFTLPTVSEAQQSTAKVEVQFGSNYIYQGGRKSKRGLKLTTSNINLPNLNAILAPSTQPEVKTVQQKQPAAQTAAQQAAAPATTNANTNPNAPRFGYGSGPVKPPPTDPRIPIDPGYDPQPTPDPSTQNNNRTQPVPGKSSSPAVVQPGIQLPQITIPFAHDYYPRTYHPTVPFFQHFHHYHHGCGRTFPSPLPLRGSLTSSRNYLSGFRVPRVSLRFCF